MTPLQSKLALSVPLLALALLCGCPGKKPAQAKSPAPAPEPTPVAAQPTPTPAPAPEAQATPEPAPTEEAKAEQRKPEKKPVHRQHPVARKPAQQDKPAVQEAKNVPPAKPDANPTPSPITIAPGPVKADPAHDQAATDQLLQTAENDLKSIKRELSQDEKDMVTQIWAFITQSRDATKNNDQVRAYNLAVKAHLLSDALAKPK